MCDKYTRAYMHYIATKEELSGILLTKHNIRYLLRLMERMRQAIDAGTLEEFVFEFVQRRYRKKGRVPEWVMDGMSLAQFDLSKFTFESN